MPVIRKTINLAVSGNRLTATDPGTGNATCDAGVQGEDGAVVLHCGIPADWQDLTVRLRVVAATGAWDESPAAVSSAIDLPLRCGVTVPGPLSVCLRGSDGTGLRRTADLDTLSVQPAAVPNDEALTQTPLDIDALAKVVNTQVVHTVTGSGGARVTRTGDTGVNVDVDGAGGDMLRQTYAAGSGQGNENAVDHALFADAAAAASSAQPGSSLEAALDGKQPALSSGGNGAPLLQGGVIKSLAAGANVTLTDNGQCVTAAARDFPGVIKPFAGTAPPQGTLLCNGSAVSRSAYPALFAAIGTAWGAGDGATTFNLPDLRGRVLAGLDPAQAEFAALGKTGGEKAHVLTAAENGPHTHGPGAGSNFASGDSLITTPGGTGGGYSVDVTRRFAQTASSGSGAAHNNLQPYAVCNYIIVC